MDSPSVAPTSSIPNDAKSMAMLSHLLSIFFGFIPALVIWLTKKQEHPFIEDQSKEALNFQITMAIAWAVGVIFAVMTLGLGSLLFPVLWIANLIFSIMAAMKAKDGVSYRYPFALRLVK
jgi:uncharacterized Tic20 family protein